jgi:hypothetical protein
MRQRRRRRLGAALFPVGAFAVHQLRYALAFGGDASRELADQGHAYLHELTPWLVLVLGFAVGGLLGRVARAWQSGECERGSGQRFVVLWGLAAGGLCFVYVGQELLEGLLATGHPQGLAGILGDGGLWALPAAVAVGSVLGLLVRGGRALVERVARLRRERQPIAPVRAPKQAVRPAPLVLPRLAPLASACAGRAPPVPLSV